MTFMRIIFPQATMEVDTWLFGSRWSWNGLDLHLDDPAIDWEFTLCRSNPRGGVACYHDHASFLQEFFTQFPENSLILVPQWEGSSLESLTVNASNWQHYLERLRLAIQWSARCSCRREQTKICVAGVSERRIQELVESWGGEMGAWRPWGIDGISFQLNMRDAHGLRAACYHEIRTFLRGLLRELGRPVVQCFYAFGANLDQENIEYWLSELGRQQIGTTGVMRWRDECGCVSPDAPTFSYDTVFRYYANTYTTAWITDSIPAGVPTRPNRPIPQENFNSGIAHDDFKETGQD